MASNTEVHPHPQDENQKDPNVIEEPESTRILDGFKKEIKAILGLAFPVAITNLFQFLICTTSLMMNGRFSKYELDGVALANSMINAFGLSIGIGLCTACDTMFSQSYGSKNKKRTGMWLQKSFLIINCIAFVVVVLQLNFGPLLILIGQDPKVSRIASEYMAIFTPGLFCQYNYVILTRYLQTQNKIFIPMMAGFFGNVFNVVIQYVLLNVYDFGYRTSSICQVGSFAILFLTEAVYILATKFYVNTWDGFKREALTGWSEFFFLALAGVGHVTLEVVCWEIGTFVAGILGTTELAEQSILFQTIAVLFMTSVGIGIAVNIRIGQNLGGNRPFTARRAVFAGWVVGFCYTIPTAILLTIFRSSIPTIFTSHEDVVEGTSQILPMLAVFLVFGTVHAISAGALRGSGRQRLGAVFIFCGFYLFAEPMGISLTLLTPMKILGFWVGIFCGLLTTMTLEFIALYKQNWQNEATKAQLRVARVKPQGEDELSPLVANPRALKRTRTLSEPRGCSIDIAKLSRNTDISDDDFSRLILKRILIYAAAVVFLAVGVGLHFSVPDSLYWPAFNNATTVAPRNETTLTPITLATEV